jgi:hypothetical protein
MGCMPDGERLDRVIAFARSIGVEVHEGELARSTRVTGVDIVSGCVHVDRALLRGIGDFLHEVAHVALTRLADRPALDEWVTGTDAQEISALAWTWAAGQYLGLEPSDVFHDAIISGNGPTLRENFSTGQYVGVPMLQYWNLTNNAAYPRMARWVRD